MKTSKLIQMLQNIDPSGELDVVVGNRDINYIEHLPAYYDGAAQIMELDENERAKKCIIKRAGDKIQIKVFDLDWVFLDNPNFPIDYDAWCTQHEKDWIEKKRTEAKKIIEESQNE
jgi:hypothetical protein